MRRVRSAHCGYPIAPGDRHCLASLLIALNALWTDLIVPITRDQPWGPAAAGLLVIGLGLPVYFLLRGRAPGGVARTSAHNVRSASAPSLAAKTRNDAGESPKT